MAHNQLAAYFRAEADPERNQSWKGQNCRPFAELSFHLARSDAKALEAILVDFYWHYATAKRHLVHELIQVYDQALHSPICDEATVSGLALIQAALRLSLGVITKDPDQIRSQLIGRLSAVRTPAVTRLIESTTSGSCVPWLMPLNSNLHRPSQSVRLTFRGHRHPASLAVAWNTQMAASFSHDAMKIWDTRNNNECCSIQFTGDHDRWTHGQPGFHDWQNPVAISRSGRKVLAAGGLEIKVFDLPPGTQTGSLSGHSAYVTAIAVTADARIALSGSDDQSVRLWDVVNAQELCRLSGHTGAIRSVVMDDTGSFALSISADGQLILWNLSSRTQIASIRCFACDYPHLAIDGEGNTAISMSQSVLQVWSLKPWMPLWHINSAGYDYGFTTTAISATGNAILTGHQDGHLRLWEAKSGVLLTTVKAHAGSILSLALSPDGSMALSSSEDATIKFLSFGSSSSEHAPQTHEARVELLSLSRDACRLLSVGMDKRAIVWSMANCGQHSSFACDGFPQIAAIGPDGLFILIGDSRRDPPKVRRLHIWDTRYGLHGTIDTKECPPVSAAFGEDNTVVAVSANGRIITYERKTGRLLRECNRPANPGTLDRANYKLRVAFSADAERALLARVFAYGLLSYGTETLKIWNLKHGNVAGKLELQDVVIRALGASCANSVVAWIASHGSDTPLLTVLDLASCKVLHQAELVCDYVGRERLLVMPDESGRWVSVATGRTVSIVEAATGHAVARFTADANITSLVFSPDNHIAVAGDELGRLHWLQFGHPDVPTQTLDLLRRYHGCQEDDPAESPETHTEAFLLILRNAQAFWMAGAGIAWLLLSKGRNGILPAVLISFPLCYLTLGVQLWRWLIPTLRSTGERVQFATTLTLPLLLGGTGVCLALNMAGMMSRLFGYSVGSTAELVSKGGVVGCTLAILVVTILFIYRAVGSRSEKPLLGYMVRKKHVTLWHFRRQVGLTLVLLLGALTAPPSWCGLAFVGTWSLLSAMFLFLWLPCGLWPRVVRHCVARVVSSTNIELKVKEGRLSRFTKTVDSKCRWNKG